MTLQKAKRYTISVGLHDKDEKRQKIATDRVLRLVANCCKGYELAFSCCLQDGGYIHENGEYVLEKSICIVLVKPEEALVEEIAKDLCAFMNQESVMVTAEEVACGFVSETI